MSLASYGSKFYQSVRLLSIAMKMDDLYYRLEAIEEKINGTPLMVQIGCKILI